MKKTILLAAAFGFFAAGTVLAAVGYDNPDGSYDAVPGAGITGSKHDLSALSGVGADYPTETMAGGADPLDRICIFCHAPHHSMVTNDSAGIDYLPLWNHEVTDRSYNMYQSDFGGGPSSVGVDGLIADPKADSHLLNADLTGQPGGVSRLCLSCHDGSVAVNEYGRSPQREYSRSGGGEMIDAQFMIGGNPYGLLNHHPIGFDYAEVAAADDEIAPVTDEFDSDGGVVTIGSLLYNGKMECVTCHDVHNSKNTGETFLWVTDAQSQFCLTCHLK